MKVDTVPVHSTTCSGRGQQNVALWKPHHWDKDPCQEWGGGYGNAPGHHQGRHQMGPDVGTWWRHAVMRNANMPVYCASVLSLWRRKMLAVHSLIDDGQCL